MASEKEIKSRVIRQTKATRRAFQKVIWAYQDMNPKEPKSVEQIADELFELGVNTKLREFRNAKSQDQ